MAHTIKLSGDGSTFSVEDNETILDGALAAGVRLPYGCNDGLCFGCLQEVESGETAYRDEIMDVGDLLKYQTMLCKAYAVSDVTLNCSQLPDLNAPSAATTKAASTEHDDKTESSLAKSKEEAGQAIANSTAETLTQETTAQATAVNPARFPVKVIRNELLSETVRCVELALPEWITFNYLPGQYIDILLDSGERRSFSIGNAEVDTGVITLYIKLISGGFFTGYVFEHLTLGTIWTIEAPLGNFIIRDNERPILMLAGSTGIAPLYAMLASRTEAIGRRAVYVYYGERHEKHLFLDKQLTQQSIQQNNVYYTPVLSRPDDSWQGRSGYVQDIAIADFGDLSAFDIYISGSPALVESAMAACLAAGAEEKSIYVDVFSFQVNH